MTNLQTESKEDLLIVSEVATILRCSNSFVYTLFRNGQLGGIRLGRRHIRISKQSVDKLLATAEQ